MIYLQTATFCAWVEERLVVGLVVAARACGLSLLSDNLELN